MPRPPHLSKSRFTAGLQCHRQLWWRVHEPDAPELVPDLATQRLFDQGRQVGELARTYVPGGYLVDLPHDRFDERLAATRTALDAGERILYEASISADRVYVAVDILEHSNKRIRLIEVKSSASVKDEHVPDVAVQAYVLESAGYWIESAELMHLNRACEYPDLDNLFLRQDITASVRAFLPKVPGLVREQITMLEGSLPDVDIGPHCSTPYECPFRTRCWAGVPDHHVTTVYYAGKKAWVWQADGYHTVQDLPADMKLTAVAERQRRAVVEGRRIIEPGLAEALARFKRPLSFLDFETVMPPIPRWQGLHPYDQVAVQFSCHRKEPGGGYSHAAWIADGSADPRRAIAEQVMSACPPEGTILAYNASFERKRLEELATAPGVDETLAARLLEIASRVADLLPVVRDYVYDPEFRGSFSLKTVVPVLVPDIDYSNLDISDGATASAALERFILGFDASALGPELLREERSRLREALERYCERDTWATVRLFETLEELAKES